MSQAQIIELTDDEFNDISEEEITKHTITLSSDEDKDASEIMTSDDELPPVVIQQKKSDHIENIFSSQKNQTYKSVKHIYKRKDIPTSAKAGISIMEEKAKDPGVNKMIAGVNVNLPVNPYGSQLALMSTLIRALKNGHNCLLESPTGSGKTLALLCGALGWLAEEKKKASEQNVHKYNILGDRPKNAMDSEMPSPMKVSPGPSYFNTSPLKRPLDVGKNCSHTKIAPGIPENMFQRNTFGEKSIYDKTDNNEKIDTILKQKELPSNPNEGSPVKGQVNIHKKSRHTEDVRMNPPTIYYGARTHKQLEQVIKEFGRTSYCNQLKMTVLSSRDYSCIREFDKQMWGTKNEMCRGCLKKVKPKNEMQKDAERTNCLFYDNRAALHHDRLPPAFDLEDLVTTGQELSSCPYFAAREMMVKSDIVFCPYNYLIDPFIRDSMRMGVHDSVIIIDEGHNIEDVCREAATLVLTRDEVGDALKELEVASAYRYSASATAGPLPDLDYLIITLKNWDQWFVNQSQLLSSTTMINNEAVYMWEAEHFANTLNNHNIGVAQYFEFQKSVTQFTQLMQNAPGSLIGVTQSTCSLLESLRITLGYFFRDSCQFMDDYRPALVKSTETYQRNWSFNNKKETETLSLRLICLNPAVVFDELKEARSIILASGTLTPLISLESELNAQFPLKISPKHVISSDRVWIGTLTSHPNGRELVCKSGDTKQVETQDALGQAILWVCRVTPNGVLCFLPSYQLMNTLANRWQETGVWKQLTQLKHVFQESKNAKDHSDNMEDYYNYVTTEKGAVLFAVYRGKVSEGMDFKDHQARAVVTVGVPYPNVFDMAVKAKMQYNDKYARTRKLLTGQEWLKVQAYRALNQAVGRCVRHIADWGAVLMIDSRFQHSAYTEHLSKWVANFLQNNHHTFESLVNSSDSLESFMQNMKVRDEEEMMSKMN